MASFSKVFKATQVSLMPEVKVLTSTPVVSGKKETGIEAKISQREEEINAQAKEMIAAAKRQAEEIIEQAERTAKGIEDKASKTIDHWWTENEAKLETMSKEAMDQGYQEGFVQGKNAAEQAVRAEYEDRLTELQQLLLQGYEQKQTIIAEAEPFLLELATAIAEQIVKQELQTAPDKFVGLIQEHILRFKEKESITICVHPSDFDFIVSQRNHLISVVNGETEIKIIPDHSVTEKGCIIRTAYGSVDARIDTQIEEIKKVLLDVRREPEAVAIG